MKRLPLMAGSLLAVVAMSACTSTQDVLEPSAIAASATGRRRAPGRGAGVGIPVQTASTGTSAPLNPAHRGAHQASLRPDRRRHGGGRHAADRAPRAACAGARHLARRQQRSRHDPCPEGLFLDAHRRLARPRSSMSGTSTTPPATGFTASRDSKRRPPAAAKAGPRCRPPPCRRSPIPRSTSSSPGLPAAPANDGRHQFFGCRKSRLPLAMAALAC